MKFKQLTATLLCVISLFCLSAGAFAVVWEDFTDISGHWAEETLRKGYADGLITGMSETTLAPNAPITAAQLITVLCRVLGASETADISALGIPADAWYADAAGKALYLGLISADTGTLDAPITRQNAFSLLARAFCLVPAEPDASVLSPFSDAAKIADKNRPALAALVSAGLAKGYHGALNVDASLTRAEFFTLLYRVAENYLPTASLTSAAQGGSVLSGSGALSYISTDRLWFDCQSARVSLIGVKAETVTLRSHKLESLSLGSSEIQTLIAAVGAGIVSVGQDGGKVGTLRLASCTEARVGAGANAVEITGSGMAVSLSGKHSSLVVTGNNNTIALSPDASVTSLKITGEGNTLSASGAVSALSVTGKANRFTLEGTALPTLSVPGGSNTLHIKDKGAVDTAVLSGAGNVLVLHEDSTLGKTELTGAGNTLTVDGAAEAITLSGRKSVLNGKGRAAELKIAAAGCTVTLAADKVLDDSDKYEQERVLELVTLGYKGDYTLKWAEGHDYEDFEKEIWVNAKGHESKTDYLIWVNLSMQRVNIFQGSAENWSLIRSSIVGTGAPGSGTPPGVWRTTYKSAAGWTTSTYTVKPVVGFRENTGYAFHSRLYRPGTTKLSDASIGYPISHGCVRMYDEDIKYIYDNIPIGTTVVVY
jgi:hypothetical protein